MIGVVTVYEVFKNLIGEEMHDEQDKAQAVLKEARENLSLRHHFKMLRKWARTASAHPKLLRQNTEPIITLAIHKQEPSSNDTANATAENSMAEPLLDQSHV